MKWRTQLRIMCGRSLVRSDPGYYVTYVRDSTEDRGLASGSMMKRPNGVCLLGYKRRGEVTDLERAVVALAESPQIQAPMRYLRAIQVKLQLH